MGKTYILSLDQGTSSSRAIVYDQEFHTVATDQAEFSQIYKNDSWVEHDPEEIWRTQYNTAKNALKKAGVQMCIRDSRGRPRPHCR